MTPTLFFNDDKFDLFVQTIIKDVMRIYVEYHLNGYTTIVFS